MNGKHLSHRSALFVYFVLAYGIAWGGILLVLATHGFDLVSLDQWDKGLIVLSMLLGPSVSGITLTAWLDGRAGLRALWSSALNWRVGWGWAAFALLPVPLLVLAVLLPLTVWVNPAFSPGYKLELFAIGLVAGCCEEIGWTAFATQRWLNRRSAQTVGLQLGVLWALWHAAADYSSNHTAMGVFWWAWFTVFWLATLPAYRVLMTWAYAHTRSLFLAMAMHASYTGWLIVLSPATSLEQGLVWQVLFAMGLWCLVAMVPRVRSVRAHAGDEGWCDLKRR